MGVSANRAVADEWGQDLRASGPRRSRPRERQRDLVAVAPVREAEAEPLGDRGEGGVDGVGLFLRQAEERPVLLKSRCSPPTT